MLERASLPSNSFSIILREQELEQFVQCFLQWTMKVAGNRTCTTAGRGCDKPTKYSCILNYGSRGEKD